MVRVEEGEAGLWDGEAQIQLGSDTEELLAPGAVRDVRLRCLLQTSEQVRWVPNSWSELSSWETRFPSCYQLYLK